MNTYRLAAVLFLTATALRVVREARQAAYAQGVVAGTVTSLGLAGITGGCGE